MLSKLISKFNVVGGISREDYWGPAYCGEHLPKRHAEAMLGNWHEQIRTCSMNVGTAKTILRAVDTTQPWHTVREFLRHMAAFSAVYQQEAKKTTAVKGARLATLLWRMCQPSKLGWLVNNLRALIAMPPEQRSMVAPGTTANEALHQRINRWARDLHTYYTTSVELDLRWFQLGALRAHNSAMYRPTITQQQEGDILIMLSRYDEITAAAWEGFLAQASDALPLFTRRTELMEKVASRKRMADELGAVHAARKVLRAKGVAAKGSTSLLQKRERIMRRRPASTGNPRKRSAFNRRRIAPRQAPGTGE